MKILKIPCFKDPGFSCSIPRFPILFPDSPFRVLKIAVANLQLPIDETMQLAVT